ncbi:hypothetical protein GCM10027586_00630 [Kineococcus gypseus]|uniref:holin n=1 Tax=Kineococcus gypseus TaxID=1637102 RepID=UPI003D7D2C55
MSVLTTARFWEAAAERAVKTSAQAALLVLGADQVNALDASWSDVGGFALGGLVLSLLTSLASLGLGGAGPSAIEAEQLVEPGRHSTGELDA